MNDPRPRSGSAESLAAPLIAATQFEAQLMAAAKPGSCRRKTLAKTPEAIDEQVKPRHLTFDPHGYDAVVGQARRAFLSRQPRNAWLPWLTSGEWRNALEQKLLFKFRGEDRMVRRRIAKIENRCRYLGRASPFTPRLEAEDEEALASLRI